MPKVANVALFSILIAGFSFARGQTTHPDANVSAVAAVSAPAAPADWPQVVFNVLIDTKKGVMYRIPVSSLEITEDGLPQKIESIAGSGSPVSLCLLIDVSGSMTSKQSEVRYAAAALVKSLPAGSEVMVSTFAEKSNLVLRFTPAAEVDPAVFARLQYGHRTALEDALVNTEPYFVRFASYPRRALVLITDRGENASKDHTGDEKHAMEMVGSPFAYVLEIIDPYAPVPEEDLAAMNHFPLGTHFAEMYGNEKMAVRAAEIAECIDRQYALSYRSALTAPDKRLHKIEVRLSDPDPRIKIESLPGYYIQSH